MEISAILLTIVLSIVFGIVANLLTNPVQKWIALQSASSAMRRIEANEKRIKRLIEFINTPTKLILYILGRIIWLITFGVQAILLIVLVAVMILRSNTAGYAAFLEQDSMIYFMERFFMFGSGVALSMCLVLFIYILFHLERQLKQYRTYPASKTKLEGENNKLRRNFPKLEQTPSEPGEVNSQEVSAKEESQEEAQSTHKDAKPKQETTKQTALTKQQEELLAILVMADDHLQHQEVFILADHDEGIGQLEWNLIHPGLQGGKILLDRKDRSDLDVLRSSGYLFSSYDVSKNEFGYTVSIKGWQYPRNKQGKITSEEITKRLPR